MYEGQCNDEKISMSRLSDLLNWFHFLTLLGGATVTHDSTWFHVFSVTNPRCYKDVTVFFLPQLDHGTKWNGFKSRFNKHLLYLCSLWLISLCFPLCFLLLLVLYFLCLAVAVQTYLEWISIKTKQTKTKTKHKNKQKGRYREHYMTNCSSLHFHSFWIIISKFFKWKKCLLFNLNSLLVRLG